MQKSVQDELQQLKNLGLYRKGQPGDNGRQIGSYALLQ